MPVAARFHELRNKTLALVDQAFAEPVRLYFFKNGKADSEKPACTIEAVLRTGGDRKSTGGGEEWKVRHIAGAATLHINPANMVDFPALKDGDKVRAISREGEPWFEVKSVNARGHTRILVDLAEA